MGTMDEIMTILNKENNYEKFNILEEIKILKAASILNLFNEVIWGRNAPLYRILNSVDRF